jgi:hypothetical protein
MSKTELLSEEEVFELAQCMGMLKPVKGGFEIKMEFLNVLNDFDKKLQLDSEERKKALFAMSCHIIREWYLFIDKIQVMSLALFLRGIYLSGEWR